MAFLGKRYVTLVIFYDENKNILLGKRLSEVLNGKYDSPGGKINPDENVIDGLQREIKEETDISISSENLYKDLSLVVSESKPSIQEYRFVKCEDEDDYYELTYEVYIYPFPKEEKALCTEPDKHEEWKFYSKTEAMELELVPLIKDYFNHIFLNIDIRVSKNNHK